MLLLRNLQNTSNNDTNLLQDKIRNLGEEQKEFKEEINKRDNWKRHDKNRQPKARA